MLTPDYTNYLYSCKEPLSATWLAMTEKDQLAVAVLQFCTWAGQVSPSHRGSEWETEYPDWEPLYLAANAVLGTDCSRWDEETYELLLYAIARDNEVELLAENLVERQVNLLAAYSMKTEERDAKWQLAVQMLRFPLIPERERLLLAYAQDADEYVRRRALMVLADLGSIRAEELAFGAWEGGEEHQRMACLHALFRLGSDALPKYLDMAERDGREHLRDIADRIINRSGEYSTG
jgi:hypothetical protein